MKFIGILTVSFLIATAKAGRVAPRVVGGEDAKPGQFPYMVQLRIRWNATAPLQHQCGGSILKENLILTAAHCISRLNMFFLDYYIQAGVLDIGDSPDAQLIKAKDVHAHPKYGQGDTFAYDIAIVVLEKNLIFNDYVQPIALPKPFETFDSGEAITVGWGTTHPTDASAAPDQLQYAKVTLLPNSECKYPTGPYENEFCAYDPLMEKSSCKGDSGGPLVKENPTRIIGIVSRDSELTPKCDGEPVIYTAVSHFIDFIDEVVESVNNSFSILDLIDQILFKRNIAIEEE